MGQPENDVRITSLGNNSQLNNKKIRSISMLGSDEKMKWKLEDDALVIDKPLKTPDWHVVAFRIEFRR